MGVRMTGSQMLMGPHCLSQGEEAAHAPGPTVARHVTDTRSRDSTGSPASPPGKKLPEKSFELKSCGVCC